MRGLMLALLLPFAAWFGMLQSLQPITSSDPVKLASLASLLSTLTIFVYRLGVWRQEMENTKNNIGAEVKAYRAESAANFERLDRRLEAIDHLMTVATEHDVRNERWQTRTERRIDRLEDANSSDAQ